MSQSHLTTTERESILKCLTLGKGVREIARIIERDPSVISREIKRNSNKDGSYSAIVAQAKYEKRREKSRRKKLLDNQELKEKLRELFLEKSWSPEQISNRFKFENSKFQISYNTIYRAIYDGLFDVYLPGQKKSTRKLRHRGKTRKKAGVIETRGKIKVTHTIHERPTEAEERNVIGHWESDTIIGKRYSHALLTLVDRSSRYLLGRKIPAKKSEFVKEKMIEALKTLPKSKRRSITSDRGKEFSKHQEITNALDNLLFYFADPHAPWQRGTNENTNGLIREFLPTGTDLADFSDADIDSIIENINHRPRKCLNWKSPHEVFFDKVLHLT